MSNYDIDALEDSLQSKEVRFRPMGEKLDSWGCSSRERTLFSHNKAKSSRNRKEVRRRIERNLFVSA